MITGVVLARNEQENIVDCLKSFRPHVAEIILIDMESSDKTVELARPYVSKVLSHPLVANFDPARNIAIHEAQHDWLWFLDADERVPPETGRLINEVVRQRGNEVVAITIPFKSYFCGQWMQHCGWWPGYTMPRVLKRGHFAFAEKLHGGVQFYGPGLKIEAAPGLAIDHFSYRSVEHYVEKFNRYTTTEALNLAERGVGPNWEEGIRSLVRDLWMYYEKNDGGRDGYLGWILSWLAGQYRWFSHAKLVDVQSLHKTAASAAVPKNLDQVFSVMRHELGRLRGQSSRAPLGLVLRTPLFDPSGYAEDARMLLKAASLGTRPVSAVEIPWSNATCQLPADDLALFRALLRGSPLSPAVAVTNCIPTLCEPDHESAWNVIRTLFETDRIPESWLPLLERFDEVWVWAHHSAVAFRQSGVAPERIRILPGFVDTSLFSPTGARLKLPATLKSRFVFLSVFDWQQRKGWDALLRAYCEEFSASDRVGLLLKISKLHGYTIEQVRSQIDSVLSPIGQTLESRPDIYLWDQTLDQAEMADLYRAADAFVLASRGEGWGRPYMEAMATGLPTIGTRGSGNADFMDDENSFLVDTTVVPVSESAANEIGVYRGHRWQEPNVENLRKEMRNVVSNRKRATAVGQRGLADMRQRYSLEVGTRTLDAMVNDVERRLASSPAPAVLPGQLLVNLEGEFFAGHSFSNVNEQLALNWIKDERVALSLSRVVHNPTYDERAVHSHRIRPYFGRQFDRPAGVTIRHAFPPNWQPPEHGRWVHIQPWEYGHLPRDWVKPLRDRVDEIWAPSNYVKNVYVRSGIPEHKIVVIPWGIDPEVYTPDVPSLHLPIEAAFKFLYVGGSVHRKGIDVLLRAYVEEFAGTRDVVLVIKDVGTSTFYRYGNYREQILQTIAEPGTPPILYLDREMTDGQRASLYAACDCLVAPYRGEGFGLPVLEGMACGLAPIVPSGGATDDFVSADEGYFLPATVVECDHEWRLCGPATELHIDPMALRSTMRQAYEEASATREKGQAAARKARTYFTWQATTDLMTCRLLALVGGSPEAGSTSVIEVPRQSAVPELDFPIHQEVSAAGNGKHRAANERLDVSVCIVARDDELTIADCLAPVRPFVREIVVVDVASRDRTAAIAREYGARVYTIDWPGSYSTARNLGLRRASSEWILRLDPGELLQEHWNREVEGALERQTDKVVGFSARCRSEPEDEEENDVRLFRNHTHIQFEGVAFERITNSIRRLGGLIFDTQVRIQRRMVHSCDSCEILALIHSELASDRRDADTFLRLGLAHSRFGNHFHAECYLNEFLRQIDDKHPDYRDGVKRLIATYLRIDDPLRAQQWQSKLFQNGNGGQ